MFVCLFFFFFFRCDKNESKKENKKKKKRNEERERKKNQIEMEMKERTWCFWSNEWIWEREALLSFNVLLLWQQKERQRQWVSPQESSELPSESNSWESGMREWEREEWVTCEKIELGFIVFGFFLLKPNNYLSNWVDAHLIQIITGCV